MTFKQAFLISMLFCLTSGGCRMYSRHKILEFWGDWNTFEQPSLSFEEMSHLPYPGSQVAYYNWMYGVRTYKPLKKKGKCDSSRETCQRQWLELPRLPLFPQRSNEPTTNESPTPKDRTDSGGDASTAGPVPISPALPAGNVPISHVHETTEGDDDLSIPYYPEGDLITIPGSKPSSTAE